MENGTGNKKAQSAMEYLITYGWAILIIAIALGVLFELGLFNPSSFVSTSCIFPADFSCIYSNLASNGTLTINMEQSTSSPINITAIGCNSNASLTNMVSFPNGIVVQIGSNVTISGNTTEALSCWSNSTIFTGKPGSIFHGYVLINYTDEQTGFPHTISGTVLEKVT
ncbi:MAG: hypothetical protein M1544_01200 [Candidatus Marsarchaeota archaeon]|nr:hypothetical protein [Candidatus Marsarchaeota archaeon]